MPNTLLQFLQQNDSKNRKEMLILFRRNVYKYADRYPIGIRSNVRSTRDFYGLADHRILALKKYINQSINS